MSSSFWVLRPQVTAREPELCWQRLFANTQKNKIMEKRVPAILVHPQYSTSQHVTALLANPNSISVRISQDWDLQLTHQQCGLGYPSRVPSCPCKITKLGKIESFFLVLAFVMQGTVWGVDKRRSFLFGCTTNVEEKCICYPIQRSLKSNK